MDILSAMTQPDGQGSGSLLTFLPMILMFGVIYFLLIRPQINRQKKQRNMLSALKKGDAVITRGGLYGKIDGFPGKDNNRVLLDIGRGNKVTVAKGYIVGLAGDPLEQPRAD